MQKTFYHYMNGKRPITVKIDDVNVTFHFPAEYDREFYYFFVSEWNYYKNHMEDKNWFSDDMSTFIDDCISDKKKVA